MSTIQPLFLALFVAANVFSFWIIALDKHRSRRGSDDRIPEVFLLLLGVFFGSLGALTAVFLFRHKTRRFYLLAGFLALFLQNLVLAYFVIY